MKVHTIDGGGGVRLRVLETGNPRGQPILFLHGFSQCSLAWKRQLDSELGRRYRLLAMDLRGHGASDKPRDGYDDSRLWGEDIHATVETLDLDQPILSGWSYAPLVILDYLRYHGEEQIGGIHFVAGVTKLGSEAALSVLTPEFLPLVPGFFSEVAEESVASLESLLRMCFAKQPSEEELLSMLGYNVSVPFYVRRALFSRVLDNDDLLPKIRKPVLITHGSDDAIVKKEVVDQHRALMPHAQVHFMVGSGHAPFWDDPRAFNERLQAFCESAHREVTV